jgi:hypothetical protein
VTPVEIISFFMDKWETVAGIAALAGTGLLFWLSGHFIRRTEHEKHRKETAMTNDRLDQRLAAVEAAHAELRRQLANLATVGDVHEIKLAIARMDGHFEAMQAQIAGQQEIMKIVKYQGERMRDFLLEHGHGAKK